MSLITKTTDTWWVKIFLSGPIETAKQIIREDVLKEGLCVTIEPTTFIYTGGEETGYVVGLINYPRFPANAETITARAEDLALKLLTGTHQQSVLIMTPTSTKWLTSRQ